MTTTERVPLIRQEALKWQAIQSLICQRIGWTEEQYTSFQFEAGYRFVDYILDAMGENDRKQVTHSKLFWGWWRNEWYERDSTVYTWPTLDAVIYQQVNTFDLHDCRVTINNFWNHLNAMVRDGSKRLAKEQKKEGK